MATGPIRAAYLYEYLDQPSFGSGAPNTNHIDVLADAGLNTAIVKFNTTYATPRSLRSWKALQSRAEARGMDIRPVYNWQNLYYLARFANPDRRYFTTSGLSSNLTGIACPNDPSYIRAMLTNACQRLPHAPKIIIDPEFVLGGGGFHSYATACFCPSCRLEWYRSENCPTERCMLPPTHDLFDAASTVLPSAAVLLLFQQGLHRERVRTYASQAQWVEAGVLDNDSGDVFHDAFVNGLLDAGKTALTWSELSYPVSGDGTPGQTFTVGFTNCTVTTGSPIITRTSATQNFGGVDVGATVQGSGFTNAVIVSIDAPNQLTVSEPWNNLTSTTTTLTIGLFNSATEVGGIWLEKWTPADLATQITTHLPKGYWLFTSQSFWFGQNVVNSQGTPYSLRISPAVTVADCTYSSGATSVTSTNSFASLSLGCLVQGPASGSGIVAGTRVVARPSANEITLGTATTAGGSSKTLRFSLGVNNCTLTNGSPIVTTSGSFSSVPVGSLISSSNGGTATTDVPSLTTVVSVDSSTQLTMSQNAVNAGATVRNLHFTDSINEYLDALTLANA